MGFALSTPFAPYFIQELGVTDLNQVKLWATAAAAGAPFSMAIVSPLWGILADRYGRKPMVMRATFGASASLTAMAFVMRPPMSPSARRMFSGVSAAAITPVACNTPNERLGFASDASAPPSSPEICSMFIGGFLADAYGTKIPLSSPVYPRIRRNVAILC